jgi:hypothetical protein
MATPSTTQHMVSPHALSHWTPVNKTHAGPASRTTSDTTIGTVTNYDDIASIDARLTAISATVYSAARLIQMTLNDKLFALSQSDDVEFGK